MINELVKLQNKVFLRYIVGGGITTLVNIALYTILVLFTMKVRWANLVAMIIAKVLSYFINKYYVYRSQSNNFKSMSEEAGKYIVARGFTGIVDYFTTVVLIEIWGFPKFLTKYFITALVIVLNYLLGKYFVFKNIGTV